MAGRPRHVAAAPVRRGTPQTGSTPPRPLAEDPSPRPCAPVRAMPKTLSNERNPRKRRDSEVGGAGVEPATPFCKGLAAPPQRAPASVAPHEQADSRDARRAPKGGPGQWFVSANLTRLSTKPLVSLVGEREIARPTQPLRAWRAVPAPAGQPQSGRCTASTQKRKRQAAPARVIIEARRHGRAEPRLPALRS